MSLQYIQKNSPRLLHTPAKVEKNPPSGDRVMRKIKCGATGAGRARYPPIHKQAFLAGCLIIDPKNVGRTIGVRDGIWQQISSLLFVCKNESCPVPLWC